MALSKLRLALAASALSMATVLPLVLPQAAQAQAPAAESEQAMMARLRSIAASLRPQHGAIAIGAASATLDIGQNYDFYDSNDARKILEDIWGNPPGSGDGVLGLVMPAGASPVSNSWGAVVTYEATGYVADQDAESTDYGELLNQLKDSQEDANAERTRLGYPAMHLVGWAENPSYDKARHAVIWARNFSTEGDQVNGLNYDFRLLGRKGVLSVNFISQMPQLDSIRRAASTFSGKAQFAAGSRYEDFNPSTDDTAEFGIGGLIAAGAGVAVAKKVGLLAILAKFGKFIFIGIVAAFAAFRKFLAGLFGFGGQNAE